jgi:hypothetical protein
MSFRNGPTTAQQLQKLKMPLRLYPNPAQNSIAIKGLDKDATYVIYDLLGHKLQTGIIATAQQIDISSLPAGHYTMAITKNGKPQTLRFIKQ